MTLAQVLKEAGVLIPASFGPPCQVVGQLLMPPGQNRVPLTLAK